MTGTRTRALLALHERGTISRSDLGSVLGITRSTAASVAIELCRTGFAEESGGMSGHVGRPSLTLRAIPSSLVIVSVELRVDSCHALAYGFGGTHLGHESVIQDMADIDPAEAARIVADLVGVVARALPAGSRWEGISVAIPGIVDERSGFVAYAPHLGWRDVEWGGLLRSSLDAERPVSFANDANLGAMGEYLRGAGRGVDAMLYVSGGIGIGGGYVDRGRLRTGGAGYAGEIGHLPVDQQGDVCRCGARGCWETRIGREVIAASWEGTFDDLVDAAYAGDARAVTIVQDAGRWLGIGLRGVIAITDPARVVLGAHLAQLLPLVIGQVREECATLPQMRAGRVEIVGGALGDDAALIGGGEVSVMSAIEGTLTAF